MVCNKWLWACNKLQVGQALHKVAVCQALQIVPADALQHCKAGPVSTRFLEVPAALFVQIKACKSLNVPYKQTPCVLTIEPKCGVGT